MKKILLILVLFAFAFSMKAQNINDAAVMQLVAQNAAAIGLQKDQAKNLKLSSTYSDGGTQYVYLLQTYKGVPIYNQMLVLAFKDNNLISHSGALIADVEKNALSASPSVAASSAIGTAFTAADLAPPAGASVIATKDNGRVLDFGKLSGVSENVTAELMWVPSEKDKSLNLVWQVQVIPAKKTDMWLMQIDATTNTLVNKVSLVVYEQNSPYTGAGLLSNRTVDNKSGFNGTGQNLLPSPPPPTVTAGNYRVVPFPLESPAHGAFSVVNNPWLNAGAGNNATTNGWHFDGTTNYDITRGNNVHAYLDVDANNTPNQTGNNFSAQSTTANPTLTFNFTPDFNQDPNVLVNKNVAVTNLFYWNNVIHDVMYQYGFTEAGGNFQTDNLGRGGLGADYVQAEAQDASGSNNANFATPVDGNRPRMQMFLFDAVSSVTLKVNTPPAIAGNYTAVESGFSTANKLANVGPKTGQLVYFNDAAGGTHEACTGAPSNSLTGKIALINRGGCGFTVKVKEAQNAGAIAAIVVNNAPTAIFAMGGTDNTITIPAVMVSDADGAILATQLANNENVTLSAVIGQRLDGDLDNGIVTHEYGHGISTRLTGGPANSSCLGSNGLGCANTLENGSEGWSDYVALMMTTNWATATVADGAIPRPMGIYVQGQPTNGTGIRLRPYTTNFALNPATYANVGDANYCSEIHNIGEIWCSAIWDMTWNIIQQENSINTNLYNYTPAGTGGNSIALKLVLEGMKLQPCLPGFLDSRNAILQADLNLYGGRHYCAIWTAFARRGMGYSAVQGSSSSCVDQTAAFDMPPAATFTTQPASTTVCLGTPVTFTSAATNTPGAPAATFKWQVSANNGATWTDIVPAVTTTSYTFTPVLADNGKQYRCVAVGACSSRNSNAATLTVTTLTAGGTLSPATTNNVCVGASGNTTTLTLSGQIGNIIQWEYSTDGGVTFPNIVANTATTLVVTNITTSRVYQVRVQSTGCAAQVSTPATINVVPGIGALTIFANQGTTLCQGDPTLLTVMTPTPAGPCNTTSGAIALPIPDAPSAAGAVSTLNVTCAPAGAVLSSVNVTLNITHTWDSDLTVFLKSPSGRIINLVNGRGGAGVNFTNTVISSSSTTSLATGTAPFTGIFAADASAAAPAPTGFTQTDASFGAFIFNSPVVNGNWQLGIRDNDLFLSGILQNWSLALGYNTLAPAPASNTYTWSPAAGLNNTTGNPVAASPAVSTTYTVNVSNAAGCTGSASIPITVNTRPAFTAQPVAATACVGSNATFAVTATGTGVTYQWQVSTDNCNTYTNIAGATSAILTVPNVTLAMSGNGYRCVISGTCPPAVNSTCVKLTVNALPVVTVTPSSGCGGVAGTNGLMLTTGGQASPPPIPGSKTFTSTTAVPVPDNSAAGATSILNVTGVPANATVTNVTVTLNMSHTYPGDMIFNLKGANGIVANLYKYNNGQSTGPASGPATWGWYGAQVSGSGTVPFTSVTAPFIYNATTAFKPDLADAAIAGFAIQNPTGFASSATSFDKLYTPAVTATINGPWTLAMADGGGGDVGTLSGWSIKIDYTTPDPATPPITYTWSPAAGLYTDATATTPYVAGATTPTVYAAPTTFTAYTVTATSNITGCINSATALINYTPPPPTVTPNPVAKCTTDPAVKLNSSSSVFSTKTFSSGPISVAIPDNTPAGATSTIAVSGIPANATISKMDVTLNITHSWAGDMIIALESPNNGTINLDYGLSATGGAGATAGFTNTVISSAGGAALSSGSGTFTGTFKADLAAPGSNPQPAPNGMTVTSTNFSSLFTPVSGVNGNYKLGIWDISNLDVGTLTSWSIGITYYTGVIADPAVWSPVTGLFSNSAGTIPYVAGTKVDSVWANPAATTTYSVTVEGSAGPTGPSQPVVSTLTANNGNALVTFNFKNNNAFPVIVTDIASVFSLGGLPGNTSAYYKTTAISGPPGAINAANGWIQFGSSTVPEIGGVVQPFMSGLTLAIPAGATYGIAVQADDAFGGNLGYNGTGAGPGATTFTAGGCSIITGPGIGFGGGTAPAAPTFTVRAFVGSISFAPAGQCKSPVRSVTVTVNTPIVFTQQPVNATVCENGTTSFTAAVTGSSLGHNWQVSTSNGSIGSFTNIANGGVYSGAKTGTLTITNPPTSMNTYTYRDSVAAASCSPGISNYVNLTVNPAPKVTITAITLTKLVPGLTTTLSAVSNPPASANGYKWFRNGVLVPGATSNTYVVDIDHLGEYTATVTDINACGSASPSNAITIADSASGKVFIYPNPNNGQFQVRYYSALYNSNLPRGINVYDARGKRVLTQTYSIGSPYARMDVDLRNHGTGVYWIEVVDVAGNRLAMGRAEVLR